MLKKVGKWVLGVIILLNVAILVTGKTYLYKGVANTYFKGKKSADIDEYKIFDNREVKAGVHQPWAEGADYNQVEIPAILLTELEELQSVAYLVVVDDSIRVEQYWDDYSADSYTNSFSMAKTIISMLTGIAIKEGKIKSLDQKVGDFLDHFRGGSNNNVTVKHLLTMSSGINFSESYTNPLGFMAQAYFDTDLKSLVTTRENVQEPGVSFKYLSGNTILLSMVLEQATGQSVSEYASEKLWKPLGARNPAYWSLDDDGGMEKAYCCFNSNARDFARLGQLYLRNGAWKDAQIVPSVYVAASIVPAELVEDDTGEKLKRYGYSWWMCDYRNDHIYLAEGFNGQYIVVIPSKDAVIVRLGRTRSKEKLQRLPKDLFSYIDHVMEVY